MPPVFAHGRLRLYLLKLLDEAPRHGYEVIRLLEERFQGLYAPSAGTVYPRLSKLEAEGLVTHATEGGRKVYSITGAGRAELADRQGELAELELEIRESVSELAAEIREDVRGSANDLRREMREAARETRAKPSGPGAGTDAGSSRMGFPDASDFFDGMWNDKEGWQRAKEEFKQAKQEWKEQARRAKEESRRARQDAQQARRQAKQAQDHARDEVLRIKERVQEQVREHARHGDWPSGILEGVSALAKELGSLAGQQTPGRPKPDAGTDTDVTTDRVDLNKDADGSEDLPAPEWATADDAASEHPARDLDRLLDRFRDDIRDAARDHGITADQLARSRAHLAKTATRVEALLRTRES
ncbi:helix-turn-helix transcriptional regulator [Streptomyces sp. NPDC050610]|uniref:helix-turn-helix transcriptional regulator n=1 Tax=Streptomyces sp. NPDC050610 TaxID=3157097 RepID=UPI00343689A5